MKKIGKLLIVALLAMTTSAAMADVFYVDGDITTGNLDGSSWENAYKDLQPAIDAAAASATPDTPHEVWVKAGIYYPTYQFHTSLPRAKSFQLKNNVAVYGGFAGGETAREARDITRQTALSGDIGALDDNSDNCYHVFYHPEGMNLKASAVLDGFTITDGNANHFWHDSGAGIFNDDSSPTLNNCTIYGNTADDGGGMYNNSSSSSPILNNCTIYGNTADSHGGGMYNNSSSSPTLNNCILYENTADNGGGMHNYDNSSPTLNDCTISGNTADTYGGGVYNNSSSSPTLNNCTISGNTADILGGGMDNDSSSSPTLNNCTISRNTADNGGGMSNSWSSSPTLNNCILSGNTATNGGGMRNNDSSPTLNDCILSGNTASSSGGGMDNSSSSPILNNCTISGNTADDGGGMYNYYNSSPTLNNCTLSGNTADDGGGMDNNSSSSPILNNCTISENTAGDGGGMGNSWSSSPTLTNCTIYGNTATNGGGGMDNSSSSPTLTNCTIYGNTATNGGGIKSSFSSSPILTNCTIYGNTAYYGGGMHSFDCSPTLSNCTLSGNTANYDGGGMYNGSSSPNLSNCTLSENAANNDGGGMYNYDSLPTLTNCILWGNGNEMDNTLSSLTLSYCIVQGGYDGETNLNVDPHLQPLHDNGGSVPTMAIPESSSARNAGTATDAPAEDARGILRTPIDGVDIGAYEYNEPLTAWLETNTDTIDFGTCVIGYEYNVRTIQVRGSQLTSSVEVDVPGGFQLSIDSLTWTSSISLKADIALAVDRSIQIRFRPEVDIDYSGTMNVSSGALAASIEIAGHGHPVSVIHVSAEGDNSDGTSWDKAFTDLQVAIDTAADTAEVLGSEVWVKADIYYPTYQWNADDPRAKSFQLKSHVSVYGGFAGGEESRNARDIARYQTVLSGDIGVLEDNTDNCYHVLYHPEGMDLKASAVLDGFTITGGNANGSYYAYRYGAGMYNYHSSPVLRNCNFSGNTADSHGGGMYNGSSSPTITNCTFSGNAADNGGGMDNDDSAPTLINCTISENTATDGGGMNNDDSSPTLINCTISENTATDGGGMNNFLSSPTLTNCTISENTARWDGGGMYNWVSSPTLTNCILWGNDTGIDNVSSTPVITYSVVQGNEVEDGEGNTNADPQLQALADNGGLTLTIALGAESSAIDAGDPNSTLTEDQRGALRPFGGRIDIGAYEHVELTVNFDTATIPADEEGGSLVGNISQSGTYPLPDNLVTAEAATNYRFVNWTSGGNVMSEEVKITPTWVKEDMTITANFIKTCTITPSVSGGNGTIAPNAPTTVDYGSNLSIDMEPAESYHVSRVVVDGTLVETLESYEFTNISEDHTITLEFAINTYTITADAMAGGTISPEGETSVDHGAGENYAITADIGYEIADVLVDGESVGAVSYYEFENVAEHHTITAEFERITYIINATANEHGTISPAGEFTVDHGSSHTFTFTPDSDYRLDVVTVDGVPVEYAGKEYILSDIRGDSTIHASFVGKASPLPQFDIRFVAGEGGTLQGEASQTVEVAGNASEVTAVANSGFKFVKWTKDGADYSTDAPITVTSVVADMDFEAVFEAAIVQFEVIVDGTTDVLIDSTVSVVAKLNEQTEKTFTLINTGNVPLALAGIELSGTNADQFSLVSELPEELAPEAQGTFMVRYAPTAEGEHTTTITIQTTEDPYVFHMNGEQSITGEPGGSDDDDGGCGCTATPGASRVPVLPGLMLLAALLLFRSSARREKA